MDRKISPKNAETVAWLAMALSFLFGCLTLLVAHWNRSQGSYFQGWYFLGGTFIWLLVLLHSRQRRLAEEERLENVGAPEGSLFEDKEDPYSAKVRLQYFEKWGIPIATGALGASFIAGGIVLLVLYARSGDPAQVLNAPVSAAFLSGFAFFSLLLSKYALGMSQEKMWKLLRAGGSYLFGNAITCFLCAVSVALTHMGLTSPEHYFAAVIPVIMGIIGAEMLLHILLGIYRPRVAGEEVHPPYDSRFLQLITGSKGFFRTLAQALDYQFGFKISETWFYQFLEKAVVPLILFMVLTIEALTSIVVVEAHSLAVVERFGKPRDRALFPGINFKWPWPIEKVYYFPVNQVQTLILGFDEGDEEKGEGHSLIYSDVNHHRHEADSLFLIAHRTGDEEFLRPYHFNDMSALVMKLYQGEDPISREIFADLSPATKRWIGRSEGSALIPESIRVALMADLNRLLEKGLLSNLLRDKPDLVSLPPALTDMIGRNVSGSSLTHVNRLILQEAYPKEMVRIPGYAFEVESTMRVEDFKDLASLAGKLQAAADPLSRYLFENLGAETRRLLANYGESPQKLQLAMAHELSSLLRREPLYQPQRFAHVALSEETLKLLAQNPEGEQAVLLNRLLLEQAYPREIAQARDIRGRTVPVNLLAINVIMNYRIRGDGVLDYMQHKEPQVLLKGIGYRELTRFFASLPMEEVLGSGRLATYPVLQEAVQAKCDEMRLGMEIVFVGVCVAHPPGETADAFEEVLRAEEEMQTAILAAETKYQTLLPEAEAQAYQIRMQSNSYLYEKEKVTAAESKAFENYLKAYRLGQDIYLCRKYLRILEEAIPGKRLYLVSVPGILQETAIINLEDPLSTGFTQLDLSGIDEEQK